ncbi:hypothetical protein IDH10_03900 [Pelagibacterales bacterium SAG-MED20]|nr:hypothetical protein [Pelagibacterales bacterium SAG-MED20]
MIKKYFLLTIIFFIFFIPPNLAAETKRTPLRDELPNLKRLSDYTIGERRVVKALKYEDRGKYKKANKLYSEALEFFLLANEQIPANANVYFYLGFTSKKLKKVLDAEIYYSLGLEVDPNHIKINNYFGKLHLENNNIIEAKQRLKKLENCNCEDYDELDKKIKELKKIEN